MTQGHVHPTAIVEAGAQVAASARLGPYCVVESGATVGENCILNAHCVIHKGTILEEGVCIDSFVAVGGLPQDIHFKPETPSGVRIGPKTVLREGVTIHRSTKENGMTTIGSGCMLMSNSHVAHDCAVEDNVIIASGALLAGHVQVQKNVFIGGGSVFHQFVRIGQGAIISGLTGIGQDVPPYVLAANRNEAHGLNLIGLKRRGASSAAILELKRLYKATLRQTGDLVKIAAELMPTATTDEGKIYLSFFTPNKRQYLRHPRNISTNDVE